MEESIYTWVWMDRPYPSGCGLINHNYVALASSSKSELVAPASVLVGPFDKKLIKLESRNSLIKQNYYSYFC
tara:strand:+ start:550 stop:765 length:216 start_codon:yes stop_codon:yes gene_type:complete